MKQRMNKMGNSSDVMRVNVGGSTECGDLSESAAGDRGGSRPVTDGTACKAQFPC